MEHEQRLRSHLEAQYGIDVTAMTDLDLGVWRVECGSGGSLDPRCAADRRGARMAA
jgi:hypothetical protein